jgi:TonB family protein
MRRPCLIAILMAALPGVMFAELGQGAARHPWAGAIDLRAAVTLAGPESRVDFDKLQLAGVAPEDFVAPVRTEADAPVYPDTAVRQHAQGVVRLECLVKPSGKVDACRISKSVQQDLDRAAFAAVVHSKYKPAKVRGVATAIIATFEMEFRLQ